MTIDKMLADIRNQLESEDSCTACGEPEAWVYLENGRSVQIVHEEEGFFARQSVFQRKLALHRR